MASSQPARAVERASRAQRAAHLAFLSVCIMSAAAHDRVLRHEASGVTVSMATHEQPPSHSCGHDALLASDPAHAVAVAGAQAYEHGGRRLQSVTYAPIRITPIYLNLTQDAAMTPELVTFVTTQLMPAAIAAWTTALSVQPVVGNLFASRACTGYWPGTPAVCATYGNADSVQCGGTSDMTVAINSTFLGADVYFTQSATVGRTTMPAGPGLPNADFAVFVTARNVGSCISSPGMLAYALSCQRDQFDRPTWGRINFCPTQLRTTAISLTPQVNTAIHEMAHALGFSASSWPLFRSKDVARTPMTPRDATFPSQPAAPYTFTFSCASTSVTVPIPANNTVQFFSERGMTCTGPSATPTNCVAKLVTPRVQAVAQWYLGCNSLQGAELENQDTTSCAVLGSHWEQRVFNTELMGALSMHTAIVSPLTLAALDDSGWYNVNYTAADGLRPSSDWGFQQGCAFALQPCLTPTSGGLIPAGNPPHFGNVSSSAYVCTTDRRAFASVSLRNYSGPLPSQYQYFQSSPILGGSSAQLDYCPFKQAFLSSGCNNVAINGDNRYFGALFSDRSSCIDSTLIWSGYSVGTLGAMCYRTFCNNQSSVTITVGPSENGVVNTSITCTSATIGASATVPNFDGQLTCPDPASICGNLQFYSLPPSPSVTPTASASASGSATSSWTVSATVSGTTAASPSVSPSVAASSSVSPSVAASPSVSPSVAASLSVSPSVAATSSVSRSVAASVTPSSSLAATTSPSPVAPSASSSSNAAGTAQATFSRWVVIVLRIAVPAGNSSHLLYAPLAANATLQQALVSAVARSLNLSTSAMTLVALTDGTGATRYINVSGNGGRSLQSTMPPPAFALQSDSTSMALAVAALISAPSDAAAASAANAILRTATSAAVDAVLQSQLAAPIAALAIAAGFPSYALAAGVDVQQSVISIPAGSPSPSSSPSIVTLTSTTSTLTLSTGGIIGVAIGGGVLVIILLVGAIWCCCGGRCRATPAPQAAKPNVIAYVVASEGQVSGGQAAITGASSTRQQTFEPTQTTATSAGLQLRSPVVAAV